MLCSSFHIQPFFTISPESKSFIHGVDSLAFFGITGRISSLKNEVFRTLGKISYSDFWKRLIIRRAIPAYLSLHYKIHKTAPYVIYLPEKRKTKKQAN
jgi:hypothetical protein